MNFHGIRLRSQIKVLYDHHSESFPDSRIALDEGLVRDIEKNADAESVGLVEILFLHTDLTKKLEDLRKRLKNLDLGK